MMRFVVLGALATVSADVVVYQANAGASDASMNQMLDMDNVAFEVKDKTEAPTQPGSPLPWVFACGALVGGPAEVKALHDSDELKNLANCAFGAAAVGVAVNPSSFLMPPPRFDGSYTGIAGYPTDISYGYPTDMGYATQQQFHQPAQQYFEYLPAQHLPAQHQPAQQHFEYLPAQHLPAQHQPAQQHFEYLPAQHQPAQHQPAQQHFEYLHSAFVPPTVHAQQDVKYIHSGLPVGVSPYASRRGKVQPYR